MRYLAKAIDTMDIVITYVDGNDPVWKKDYEKYTEVPVMEKRFRDWGTLKSICLSSGMSFWWSPILLRCLSGLTRAI